MRVTLGSAKIRFIVTIVGCPPVVGRPPRWRVGKTRSGVRGDHALIARNMSVPPMRVMRRSRVCRATQDDQKAQGHNTTSLFLQPTCRACLGRARPPRSQQWAASRLVTSLAPRWGVYLIMARSSYVAELTRSHLIPDRSRSHCHASIPSDCHGVGRSFRREHRHSKLVSFVGLPSHRSGG